MILVNVLSITFSIFKKLKNWPEKNICKSGRHTHRNLKGYTMNASLVNWGLWLYKMVMSLLIRRRNAMIFCL